MPKRPKGRERLIVAVDVPDLDGARRLLDLLGEEVDWFKVGLELYTAVGPRAVELLVEARKRVFLDLKFHDIPNTVAGAARSAARLGVAMFNVHAHGGPAMMRAAAEAVAGLGENDRPLVIGVTVLTSLDQMGLEEIGVSRPLEGQVLAMAALTHRAGLDGVVASPREASAVKASEGPGFLTVTPGVRPAWGGGGRGGGGPGSDGVSGDDQKRVLTPGEAVRAGSDYLVVGRPITAAADPRKAAGLIIEEIVAAEEAAGEGRP
ncbi:MAG: orotidine-5'-phosphate decarboxylase [Bacillota bacterium]